LVGHRHELCFKCRILGPKLLQMTSNPCLKKIRTTIFWNNFTKDTDYLWFLADMIVIHLPTDYEWKIWYNSTIAWLETPEGGRSSLPFMLSLWCQYYQEWSFRNVAHCTVCLQHCWVLYCDLVCLNYDGNLLDTCVTALTAALRNGQLVLCFLVFFRLPAWLPACSLQWTCSSD